MRERERKTEGRRKTEEERLRRKNKNNVKMLVDCFSRLNGGGRDTGSFRQSTHKPPGAVCVAGLAVNQKGLPTGLQVQQAC